MIVWFDGCCESEEARVHLFSLQKLYFDLSGLYPLCGQAPVPGIASDEYCVSIQSEFDYDGAN